MCGWVGRSFVKKDSRLLSDLCVTSRWGSYNIRFLGKGQKTALRNPKYQKQKSTAYTFRKDRCAGSSNNSGDSVL